MSFVRNLRITRKLGLGFGLVGVLLGLVVALGAVGLQSSLTSLRDLSSTT